MWVLPDQIKRQSRVAGIVCLILLALYVQTALAQEEDHHHSVLINPLGTIAGVVATALSFPSMSLNGRYQYAYTESWALNCAPQFVYTDLVTFENYMMGVKAGPRYSLSQRFLEGWYLSPMILAGFTLTRQFGSDAQSAFMIGLGAEAGYAWHWEYFVFELGGGLHYSGLVGHTSTFRGESGKTPPFGVGPILNASLGYGW